MEDIKIRLRERKPLFALALSFFLPGLGQVYSGKLRRGIFLFSISVVLPLLIFQLSVFGPDKMLFLFLLLSVLTALGIYIWAAWDAWKQAKRTGKDYTLKFYNRLSIYILLVILLTLLPLGRMIDLQKICLFASPYRMATGSMKPGILPGDFVITDRRVDHSAENHGLKRGELVVFKYPRDRKIDFVKRVIGLPGDEVELKGFELYVNRERKTGKEVSYVEGKQAENIRSVTVAFHEEGDSGSYVVCYIRSATREDLIVSVPEGYCFVLGDNRDRSEDSRHWGMVPLIDVVARPKLIYCSIDPKGGIRWRRIGKSL